MSQKHKTKPNKLKQATVMISSACMILASFGVTNIQAKDSISPITDLRFASELTHNKPKTKTQTETKVDETSNELVTSSVSYNEDKTVATLSIKSANSDYTISLSDDSLEACKELFENGTLNKTDVSSNEMSISTSTRGVYMFDVLVKDASNTLIKTETISFKALDVFDTNVSTASDDGEAGSDVSSQAVSTVQTSHDSQSMTVKYTSPGSYTWSIPSEVDLNNQQSMTVSATKVNEEANASLKISVSSENGFKMKSSTGRSGAYKITQDGKQIQNNSLVLETTSTGTSSTDLNFFAYPGNFMTADTYNDTLTFKAQNGYMTGTVLEIEGMKFIVMSQTDDDSYLVISGSSIGNIQFQPNIDNNGNFKLNVYELPDETRADGQNSNVYEKSYIDNYLENTWYSNLPSSIKNAIQVTQIKQSAWESTDSSPNWRVIENSESDNFGWCYNEGTSDTPKWVRYDKATFRENDSGAYPLKYWKKHENSSNGQRYNTISRHAYLPSIDELSNLVDLNSANKTASFLKGINKESPYIVGLRDSSYASAGNIMLIHSNILSFGTGQVTHNELSVRPAFVIDLSKVNATIVDTVHYK